LGRRYCPPCSCFPNSITAARSSSVIKNYWLSAISDKVNSDRKNNLTKYQTHAIESKLMLWIITYDANDFYNFDKQTVPLRFLCKLHTLCLNMVESRDLKNICRIKRIFNPDLLLQFWDLEGFVRRDWHFIKIHLNDLSLILLCY
jgi:hypothetical protein